MLGALGAGSVLSGVGGIFSAFGSNKLKPIRYSNEVSGGIDYLGGKTPQDDLAVQEALGAFKARQPQTIAELDAAKRKATTDYDTLFQQTVAGGDPYGGYERLRGGNLAAFKDVSDYTEGRGRASDALAQAALGRGGRSPGGSYETRLRTDRIAGNYAPILGGIFSNLGRDTSALEAARQANTATGAGLIGSRLQVPMYGYGMELDPAEALLGFRGQQADILGSLSQAAAQNTAGFQQQKNWADKVGGAFKGAGEALSLGGMMGGGGGGGGMGMLGGLFGGGGGGGGVNPNFIATGESGGIPQWNRATPAAQAWYSGGGGGNYGGYPLASYGNWGGQMPAMNFPISIY